MSEPERTLEQALIEYLFPKKGPQERELKAYGATDIQRAIVARLPERMQQQLVRLCDANPLCALDLITFAIDISDHSFDEGRSEGYDEATAEAAESTRVAVENWSKL